MNLEQKLKDLQSQASMLKSTSLILQKDITDLQQSILIKEEDKFVLDETSKFFSKSIELKIIDVKTKIEDLINKGLTYIFDDDLQIRIDPVYKNNKTQFILKLRHKGVESAKIEESFGGGVFSIVSFLFKVVTNILIKNERIMVFDETTSMVSLAYQEPLSQFIRKLCEEMHLTLILITHQPSIAQNSHICYEAYKDSKTDSTKFREVTK